jgi:transposase
VAFSAGGDGGRRPPELPAQNSHTSFAATSDALEILIDGMVWIGGIRGFLLEHGVPVRQGHRFLRQQLPQILATRADVLSPRIIRIIADLIEDWKYLDERIARVTDEIETLARAGVGRRFARDASHGRCR